MVRPPPLGVMACSGLIIGAVAVTSTAPTITEGEVVLHHPKEYAADNGCGNSTSANHLNPSEKGHDRILVFDWVGSSFGDIKCTFPKQMTYLERTQPYIGVFFANFSLPTHHSDEEVDKEFGKEAQASGKYVENARQEVQVREMQSEQPTPRAHKTVPARNRTTHHSLLDQLPKEVQSYLKHDYKPEAYGKVMMFYPGTLSNGKTVDLDASTGENPDMSIDTKDATPGTSVDPDSDASLDTNHGPKHTWPEGSELTYWNYVPWGIVDPINFMLVAYATFIVAFAAFVGNYRPLPVSSRSESGGGGAVAVANVREDIMALDKEMIIGFFLMGSLMLTILYFTVTYVYHFLVFMYCWACTTSCGQLLSVFVWNRFAFTRKSVLSKRNEGRVGKQLYGLFGRVRLSDIVGAIPGAMLAITYLLIPSESTCSWIIQDIMALIICSLLQKTLKLPNLKMGVAFLTLMFGFDIYWVFYSDRVFGSSVMETVAEGGGRDLPMLIKFVSFVDDLPQRCMLGLGDIALPGLLITYNMACDWAVLYGNGQDYNSRENRRKRAEKETRGNSIGNNWYDNDSVNLNVGRMSLFQTSLVGYTIGLMCALVMLQVYQQGQPALLYLNPGVVISTVGAALKNGEFRAVWNGTYFNHENEIEVEATEASGRMITPHNNIEGQHTSVFASSTDEEEEYDTPTNDSMGSVV